jgi:hypothetical protein
MFKIIFMQKKNFLLPCLLVIAVSAIFLSCTKNDLGNLPFLNGQRINDVAEYDLPYYNIASKGSAPLSGPFLFKKIYDPYSHVVKEIDCSFFNNTSSNDVGAYQLLVVQSGRRLLFLNKKIANDTLMKVDFNSQGRVQSFISTFPVSEENSYTPLTNTYTYKNNRLLSLTFSGKVAWGGNIGDERDYTDTFKYDTYGNVLSRTSYLTYSYDYTKKATQQCCIDDYMDFNNGFYLLQYMGLFPELTSPVNIRVFSGNPLLTGQFWNINFSDHQFDKEGRLISYSTNGGTATIVWNSK